MRMLKWTTDTRKYALILPPSLPNIRQAPPCAATLAVLAHSGREMHMTKRNKTNHMKLGLSVRPVGHHVASWRHPDSHADANVNFKRFVEMAQTAERGCFDMMFSADTQSAWTTSPDGLHRIHYVAWIEPFTQMAALQASPAISGWFALPAPPTRNRSHWRASSRRSISSARAARAGI